MVRLQLDYSFCSVQCMSVLYHKTVVVLPDSLLFCYKSAESKGLAADLPIYVLALLVSMYSIKNCAAYD